MILLTDNSQLKSDPPLTKAQWESLTPILNRPLGELLDECGEKLLVFPHSFTEAGGDGAERQCILSGFRHGETYTLEAGNLAGFISCGGEQISILSRFFGVREQTGAQDSDSLQDYFLHYLLQKVLSVNITTLPHKTSRERLFDLLPYFFPTLLNRAMRQGLYREYRHMQHNDARVRGRIDVARHLRQNIPFVGKIAYNTREFSCNNAVTQLVRHTIEHLRRRHEAVLSSSVSCREHVATIISSTPDYNPQTRGELLRQKTRRHPYYTEYGPLQTLCRSILLHETLSYGHEDREVNGILFDVAWLWEEYLWKLLEPLGFKHPRNKNRLHPDRIHLAIDSKDKKHFARFPDFYREEPPAIVLDAKYKWKTSERAHENDIHQVITYMFRLQAQHGILLLPPQGEGWSYSLLGQGGKPNGSQLTSKHFSIPEGATDYTDFSRAMGEREKELINYLTPLLQQA